MFQMFSDSYFRYKKDKLKLKQKILILLFIISTTQFTLISKADTTNKSIENNYINKQKLIVQDLLKEYKSEVEILQNKKDLPFNHVYESSYTLKPIPDFDLSKTKKIKTKKNPFLIENQTDENNTSYFLNNLNVSGIINIDNELMTVVSSNYGIDIYKVGELIGEGYLVKSINSNPASVVITNNKNTRLFNLED